MFSNYIKDSVEKPQKEQRIFRNQYCRPGNGYGSGLADRIMDLG